MIYPIYTYGEDVLRKKAEDVNLDDPKLSALIEDMFTTMRIAKGAGLAAPQIGISKKIVVVDEEISDGVLFKAVFLNPKIISYGDYYLSMIEGCLSFPDMQGYVIRPNSIDVEWYDENKNYHRELISNIKSRIIQHEVDHLNGTLYIDRMDPEDKMKLFFHIQNIKNKKVKTLYEIK